jgi:YD repeat-containing protein
MTAAHVPASLLEDVLLVVSELVTNAAVHAKTTTRVTVRWDGNSALVEVFDADEHPPVLSMKPLTVGGWGLHLVDRISRVWGSEASADGKRVWAEVACER